MEDIVADFVDFIANVGFDDPAKREDLVDFYNTLKKEGVTAKDLKTFFDSRKYDGVTLDDCEKLVRNKKALIEYGDALDTKSAY